MAAGGGPCRLLVPGDLTPSDAVWYADMVVGTFKDLVPHFPGLPESQVRLAVAPTEDALLAEFAAGVCDWAVWPKPPPPELVARCLATCARRPVAAACMRGARRGTVSLFAAGQRVLRSGGLPEDLSIAAARSVWLDAWAGVLTALPRPRWGSPGLATRLFLASLTDPNSRRLPGIHGKSGRWLQKRLAREGLRGRRRLALAARGLLAWERLRVGGAPLEWLADELGYSGLAALDRALGVVVGAPARAVSELTDLDLTRRLRAALRREQSGQIGKEMTEPG